MAEGEGVPTPLPDDDPEQADEAGVEEEQAKPGDDTEDDAPLPEPMEAVLERIPPEEREKVRSLFLGLSQYVGPVPHPLFGKMSDEHLHKLIDGADKDNERSYQDRDSHRSHVRTLAISGMVLFLVSALLFMWMDQAQLLANLVQLGVAFAGGIGVGVGFTKRKAH